VWSRNVRANAKGAPTRVEDSKQLLLDVHEPSSAPSRTEPTRSISIVGPEPWRSRIGRDEEALWAMLTDTRAPQEFDRPNTGARAFP